MRASSSATSVALLALAACVVLGAPSPDAQPNGQVMRLSRRVVERTPDEWGLWAKNHREALHVKYGKRAATSSKSKQKRGSGTNLLVNQDSDSTYFGSLAIGTPSVAFDVILDTGSA